jgi:hypothetical protein
MAELTWSSPKGKFTGAGKEISEALGFDVAMDMDCDPHGVVINVMSHK